jgi:hypothetical protein
MNAEVINIPERWSKLFMNHQLFKYNVKGQELYAGLLVRKLEKITEYISSLQTFGE